MREKNQRFSEKSSVGGDWILWRPGSMASLPLNPALLRSGAGAEREQSGSKSQMSGAEREVVGAGTEW